MTTKTVRIGSTGDFTASGIALGLKCLRVRRPDLRFELYNDDIDTLMRDLREGDSDLGVWVSATGPELDTRHHWTEQLVWLRSPATKFDLDRPVPLVSYGGDCLFTRNAVAALGQAGLEAELTFTGLSLVGLCAAVRAGIGVLVLPKSTADIPGLTVWNDSPLPKLPDIFCGIYVRGGNDAAEREQIADDIAASLRPQPAMAGAQRMPEPVA